MATPHSLALTGLVSTLRPISPAGLWAVRCGSRSATSPLHPPVLPIPRKCRAEASALTAHIARTCTMGLALMASLSARAAVRLSRSQPWRQHQLWCALPAPKSSWIHAGSAKGQLTDLYIHDIFNLQPAHSICEELKDDSYSVQFLAAFSKIVQMDARKNSEGN